MFELYTVKDKVNMFLFLVLYSLFFEQYLKSILIHFFLEPRIQNLRMGEYGFSLIR